MFLPPGFWATNPSEPVVPQRAAFSDALLDLSVRSRGQAGRPGEAAYRPHGTTRPPVQKTRADGETLHDAS